MKLFNATAVLTLLGVCIGTAQAQRDVIATRSITTTPHHRHPRRVVPMTRLAALFHRRRQSEFTLFRVDPGAFTQGCQP